MGADRIIGLCNTDLIFYSLLQLEVYEEESVVEGMYISTFLFDFACFVMVHIIIT